MKQRILITMLIATAMSVVGCSKSDTPNTTTTPDDYELSTTSIGFTAEESATRGSITNSFSNGSTMGIVAYYLAEDAEMSTTAPNFMYNQKVDYDGTYWTYTPTKYWPVYGSVNFYAYSPYDSSIILSGEAETGYPKIYFVPATNASSQVDFMTAQASGNIGENSTSGVSLSFSHQLSQVYFSGKYSSTADYDITVTQIELKGVKAAEYGEFSVDGFSWSTDFNEEATTYSNAKMSGTALVKSDATADDSEELLDFTQVTSTSGYMFLHPQNLTDQQVSIVIYFDMTSNNITSSANIELTVGEHEYEKAKAINYQFTLDVDNFVVAGVASAVSEDWIDGTDIFTDSQDIE